MVRYLIAALIIVLPLYIWGTFGHDLWRPTEAREAGIAREMIENGNWTATYLNGTLFLEKPPLYTWAIASCLKLFGYHDWAVRIPAFIFTLGILILMFVLARQGLSPLGASAATVSLGTMYLFMQIGHNATIDNGLMFFIMAAMTALITAQKEKVFSGSRAVILYGSIALAFLCKGLVGPVLIIGAMLFYMAILKNGLLLKIARPLAGFLIVLLIAGSWFLALWHTGGESYFRTFFITNHVYRFTGYYGPAANFWYYIPYLFIAPLPWTLLVPCGVWIVAKRWKNNFEERPFWTWIGAWACAMFIVLSAAGSKDDNYFLPLLPPFAIAAGAWVEHSFQNRPAPRWTWLLTIMFVVCCGLLATTLPLMPYVMDHQLTCSRLIGSLMLGIISFTALFFLLKRSWRTYWRWAALLPIGAGTVFGLFLEKSLNEIKSSRPLCALICKYERPDSMLYGYALGENTSGLLIFYGIRSQNVGSIFETCFLFSSQRPVLMLLDAASPDNVMVDVLTARQQWLVLEKTFIGNKHFWLLGNNRYRNPDSVPQKEWLVDNFHRLRMITEDACSF
ncbi:MAG: glycosyltransferase family 39 protein [Kiritimatiellaeota bacterium]|nr:glycosyltransferase family 39 protein [Kiritimatiellota bacterium]